MEIGGFRHLELLAEGGTARVYRAEGPDGPAALKIFHGPLPPEVVEQLRGLPALDHPHLARYLAIGSDWAAMELLEGPDLEAILAAGPLPVGRALRLAAGIAEGLAALHAAGWVHRDLKPSNVIVLPGDLPKIVDLGLARRMDSTAEEASFEGSWGFAAPEQVQGRPADPRSDVYALGVVLYRMLLGRLPFGDAPVAAALGHLHDRPPPPRRQDPSIPPEVEALLLRALAKEPQDRFPTMEAFAAALRAAEPAPPAPVAPWKWRWLLDLGTAIALVIVAAKLAC